MLSFLDLFFLYHSHSSFFSFYSITFQMKNRAAEPYTLNLHGLSYTLLRYRKNDLTTYLPSSYRFWFTQNLGLSHEISFPFYLFMNKNTTSNYTSNILKQYLFPPTFLASYMASSADLKSLSKLTFCEITLMPTLALT